MGTPLGFEDLMNNGMDAHALEDHEEALGYRFRAFYMESPEPWDRARAARDISASFDRLAKTKLDDSTYSAPVPNRVLAEAYAEYAYRDHKALHDQGIERGSREYTVSAMYHFIALARGKRKDRKIAVTVAKEAWSVSEDLYQRYGRWHQYDVNMIGRVAAIEGALGGKPTSYTHRLGNLALKLAPLSETKQILERDITKSPEAVASAQSRAKQRGQVANILIRMRQFPAYNWTLKPIAILGLKKIL